MRALEALGIVLECPTISCGRTLGLQTQEVGAGYSGVDWHLQACELSPAEGQNKAGSQDNSMLSRGLHNAPWSCKNLIPLQQMKGRGREGDTRVE